MRRLAGCIAIELLLAAGLPSADFEYKAGTGAAGLVKALALEDRSGSLAVIAQAEFSITRSISDFVAAQLLKAYGLDRAALLLHSSRQAEAAPRDLVAASAAAIGNLQPARVLYGQGLLSVIANGLCLAVVFPLAFENCGKGAPVHAPLRAAFQLVDLTRGLQQRDAPLRFYPVQAIAFGKQVTFLALGGDAPAARFNARNRVVVPFSNDSTPLPEDPRVETAIRQVLARVGN